MFIRPLPSFTAAALTLGLCMTSPGEAQAARAFVVQDFSLQPNGSDLGYGNYPDSTASKGPQCEGIVNIGRDTVAHVTSVVLYGETMPHPKAVVIHRPGKVGSPKRAGGTDGKWKVITHEHGGSYVPKGTWTVILPKYEDRTCAETYDGRLTLKISGIGN